MNQSSICYVFAKRTVSDSLFFICFPFFFSRRIKTFLWCSWMINQITKYVQHLFSGDSFSPSLVSILGFSIGFRHFAFSCHWLMTSSLTSHPFEFNCYSVFFIGVLIYLPESDSPLPFATCHHFFFYLCSVRIGVCKFGVFFSSL